MATGAISRFAKITGSGRDLSRIRCTDALRLTTARNAGPSESARHEAEARLLPPAELPQRLAQMIVMPANNTGIAIGYLAGRYLGRIGHLFSPRAQRGPFTREFGIPYAFDNGRFSAGEEWSEADWIKMLDWGKLSGQKPLWVLVPDVVGDRIRTLRSWEMYADRVSDYGWPLAFAVQDGMATKDVPISADVVFVGGSTEWKWRTLGMWCGHFQRVHVGRVNTYRRLWQCHDARAESCDGTGWMRGDQVQARGLRAYLEESTNGGRVRQMELLA